MVAITTFMSAISMALLATAAPSVEKRQGDAVIDFTLYSPPATNPTNCWGNSTAVHLRTPDINSTTHASACHRINFSTFRIDDEHIPTCFLNVYDTPNCSGPPPGSDNIQGACQAVTSKFGAVDQLQSWQVQC